MENEEYKVKQIWPAHADHISGYNDKFLNNMFGESVVVCQRKYDGERMLVHFNDDETYCTSRRHSKKTNRYMENQDKIVDLPHMFGLGYTVIDCECYADSWSDIVGVLHSLPERAFELQQTVKVRFAVFDCLFYGGIDVRDMPYKKRFELAQTVVKYLNGANCNDSRFHMVDNIIVCNKAEAMQRMEEAVEDGFEGVVVKSLNKAYYDKGAMLKCKKFETVDTVVYGYQEGRGKYEGTVGALLIGYYDPENDKIVHISKVNCGTDADRDMWKEWFDNGTAVGRVLEVKCQEVTDRSLRHPVYVRIREDKDYKTCTKETIFKE